jgi:hypothetical protein
MTNTLENCTEKVQETFADTIKPISIDLKQNAEKITENEVDKYESKTTLIRSQYLLLVKGDPKFRLDAKSARKNSVKAEFTAAGWVYKNKNDAEDVAKRWTEGNRKLSVVTWYDSRLDDIWNGTKSESQLAKKSIRLEIDSDRVNTRKQEIIFQCHQSPLHPSWLYSENISKLEIEGCSDKEKQAYEYFKPLWDKTSEELKEIDLRSADIAREEEDLNSSITNEIGQEVVIGGIPKKVTDMHSLDKRFAQLEAHGQPCVFINRLDAQPISPSDFNRRLSGEVVFVGVNADGHPKYIAANTFWTGNSRKCIYRRIVFTNNEVDNSTYNLFSGFGLKPKQGKCDKILNHIKEVICADDETNNNALLKLLAWQIQNIGQPSRVITALKSTIQQAGKGCLLADILAVIYGNSGFVTSDVGQIITRFNDTIRGKAFVFLDEALFSGDRKAADAIKSLATCTRMGVETKGIPTVQFPIAVNLFLATNHDDAAHIEEADARYWILEVSPHRAGDSKYFKSLYEEINNGGREAFMNYLLNIDVSAFIPSRDIPKDNAAKEAMIRNSINPFDARKWLEECCRAEMILGYKPIDKDSQFPWEIWKADTEFVNGIFYTAYSEWKKTVKSPTAPRPTPANKFGELLNKAGITLRIQDSQRWRKLPKPEDCLKSIIDNGKNDEK